ncbi:MAG: toll/interleukin-1 receptor domain-containing protein, partial [Chlamydiia bacterium]|nr:toll/interleukin-1 receptor domain-containing protein [Chlamydiia bacterium]
MSTIPPISLQGKISCYRGQLQVTCENKTIRAHLIEPSGGIKNVTVEGFPDFLSNSENIQAFLNQSYVKLSESKNGEMTARLYTKGLGGGKVEQLKAELDKKGKDKKAVFISYHWDHKDLAKALEAALTAEGIIVLRDEGALQQSG